MDIKERMGRIIQSQRERLQAEIEMYEEKRDSTEEYYGFGGAYRRQQSAIEKREKQIEELDDFEAQMEHAEKHQEVKMYVFVCRECGSVTMVNIQPLDDWHECPVCRKMVYLPKLESTFFKIVDTGESWMEQLRKAAGGSLTAEKEARDCEGPE